MKASHYNLEVMLYYGAMTKNRAPYIETTFDRDTCKLRIYSRPSYESDIAVFRVGLILSRVSVKHMLYYIWKDDLLKLTASFLKFYPKRSVGFVLKIILDYSFPTERNKETIMFDKELEMSFMMAMNFLGDVHSDEKRHGNQYHASSNERRMQSSIMETYEEAMSMKQNGSDVREIEESTGWRIIGEKAGKEILSFRKADLESMSPVEIVSYDSVPKFFSEKPAGNNRIKFISNSLLPWVKNNAFIGKVANSEIGEIVISKSGLKDSLVHGYNRYKARFYPVLKKLLSDAIVLDEYYENGRLHSYILGAKFISEEGNEGFVGIVIGVERQGNKYYSHSIIQKNKSEVTGLSQKESSPKLHPTISSVFAKVLSVNNEVRYLGLAPEASAEYEAVRQKYYGTEEWMKAPYGKDTLLYSATESW